MKREIVLPLVSGMFLCMSPGTAEPGSLTMEPAFFAESGDYGSQETIRIYSAAITVDYTHAAGWCIFLTAVPWIHQNETYTDLVLVSGRPVPKGKSGEKRPSGPLQAQPAGSGPVVADEPASAQHHPEPPADHSDPIQDTSEAVPVDNDHQDPEDHHLARTRLSRDRAPLPRPDQATPRTQETTPVTRQAVREKDSVSGPGDTVLGFSLPVRQETDRWPEIQVQATIKLPTADEEKGLGTGEVDYGIGMKLEKSVGPWLALGELNYNIIGSPDAYSLNNYLAGSLGLSAKITPFLEGTIQFLAGEPMSEKGEAQIEMKTSFCYDFKSFGEVFLEFSLGMARGSPDYLLGLGYLYTF